MKIFVEEKEHCAMVNFTMYSHYFPEENQCKQIQLSKGFDTKECDFAFMQSVKDDEGKITTTWSCHRRTNFWKTINSPKWTGDRDLVAKFKD